MIQPQVLPPIDIKRDVDAIVLEMTDHPVIIEVEK